MARALEERKIRTRRWDRVLRPGVEASPWPPGGPFDTAFLRLPRAKDELEMLVHAAASRLRAGGSLFVYGAKDEGIRSAPARIEPLLGSVTTVTRKNRCRVLRAERPRELPELRPSLEEWKETWRLEVDGMDQEWISYPGVFAHGRLDPGTALLLDFLDDPPEGGRVLDFGCGSGIVGGVLLERWPSLEVELLDVDAVALEAARANVPDADVLLADGLPGPGTRPYDRIVSNPPYHRSKAETLGVVRGLIRDAPARLTADGGLSLVVQRRLPVGRMLEERFRSVEVRAENGTYRVWAARRPRSG